MKTTTKDTQLTTIDELRARYPYIPAYSSYMSSFDYWTVSQLRQAEALNANTDCYRVDSDQYYTIGMIENEQLFSYLKDYVAIEQSKSYFLRQLDMLSKGGGYKQQIKLSHLESATHWLSLDETTAPLLIKWLKKQYPTKK